MKVQFGNKNERKKDMKKVIVLVITFIFCFGILPSYAETQSFIDGFIEGLISDGKYFYVEKSYKGDYFSQYSTTNEDSALILIAVNSVMRLIATDGRETFVLKWFYDDDILSFNAGINGAIKNLKALDNTEVEIRVFSFVDIEDFYSTNERSNKPDGGFTIQRGNYEVGVDFPSGIYDFPCSNIGCCFYLNDEFIVLYEGEIYSNLNLKDGDKMNVTTGTIHFEKHTKSTVVFD